MYVDATNIGKIFFAIFAVMFVLFTCVILIYLYHMAMMVYHSGCATTGVKDSFNGKTLKNENKDFQHHRDACVSILQKSWPIFAGFLLFVSIIFALDAMSLIHLVE